MPEILQLKQFFVTSLHVDLRDFEGAQRRREGPVRLALDYDVLRREDAPQSFALKLRVGIEPADKQMAGYEIKAEIVGFFDFPPNMDEQQMQNLIRVNGSAILYGILRGEIAAFTGSFPGGKFSLPAVYMPDMVKIIEERKRVEAEKPPLRKKGPRPRPAQRAQ